MVAIEFERLLLTTLPSSKAAFSSLPGQYTDIPIKRWSWQTRWSLRSRHLCEDVAVLLFAVLAGTTHRSNATNDWLRFALLQVTLGPLAGAIIGYAGARSIETAAEREWATTAFHGIDIRSLSVLAYVVAEIVGGNGFISAFVSGMVFGHCIRHPCSYLFEFMESEGHC